MENSKPGELNKKDWKSMAKSLGLTVIAAVVIVLADWLANLDLVEIFGKYAPYVAVILPMVINFLRRWGGTAK